MRRLSRHGKYFSVGKYYERLPAESEATQIRYAGLDAKVTKRKDDKSPSGYIYTVYDKDAEKKAERLMK
jgi:hypothetical protein